MPTTKAQQKAVHAYIKRNYTRLEITIPREQEEALKAHAAARGYSVNGLVNLLLRRDMGLNALEWKSGGMKEPATIEKPDPAILTELFHGSEEKYYATNCLVRCVDAVKAIDATAAEVLLRGEMLPFNASTELTAIGREDDPEKRAALAADLVKEVNRIINAV